MDQIMMGTFLAKKRKEKNMTQAALAERLGVTNKTISKWETGKCMPDYSVIELLCKELEITVAELLDGEEKTDKSVRVYDDTQILELLKRTQNLENQRTSLYGMILIIIGLAFLAIHFNIGGEQYQRLCIRSPVRSVDLRNAGRAVHPLQRLRPAEEILIITYRISLQ